MEAHSLRKRGWSISAIARHLGRDRKTIAKHLNSGAGVGARERPEDRFGKFVPYIVARSTDDKHLWTTVLYQAPIESFSGHLKGRVPVS